MDPDANLREQRELAQAIINEEAGAIEAERLAELVLALDEWIDKGGFLPTRWRK